MSHKFKASQIAQVLNGTLDGDPEVEVYKLAKIEEGSPGAITFLSNPKYRPFIYTTTASVVIVKDDFQPEQPLQSTLIRVADPYSAFTQLLEFYNQMRISSRVGIESPVSIDPSSSLGENVYIGAFTAIGAHCKIGNNVKIYANTTIGDHVTIADNTIIFSNVAIYADSVIGANCILHSGVVIGADGFGFAPQEDGSYKKMWNLVPILLLTVPPWAPPLFAKESRLTTLYKSLTMWRLALTQ